MSGAASSGATLRRAVAAFPDVLASTVFVLAWIAPWILGTQIVIALMITMILEFLAVHSGAFIGLTVLDPEISRLKRALAVLGFGAVYMLFALGFSIGFGVWWPAVVFAWLLLGKFALIWISPVRQAEEHDRHMTVLFVSMFAYFGGILVTAFLPLPRLGVDEQILQAAAAALGSGLWVDEPQTVLAFGAMYFGTLAWAKWSYRPLWASPKRQSTAGPRGQS